jgi:hypothetical protein
VHVRDLVAQTRSGRIDVYLPRLAIACTMPRAHERARAAREPRGWLPGRRLARSTPWARVRPQIEESIMLSRSNPMIPGVFAIVCSLSAALPACREDATPASDESASVELQLDMAETMELAGVLAADGRSLADAAALVVTIVEEASGSEVYDAEQIELYDFNGTYLSHPLSLSPGAYALAELLVVDESGNVLFATPLEGSPLAHLVADPLEISFTVTTDAVTTVRPQVVSTEARVPQDFGYASFEIDIVERLDFLVAAFVYSDTAQGLAPTAASIAVTNQNGTEVFYAGTLQAATNQITVPAGHGQYRVEIEKPGYAPYSQPFTEAELAAHFEGTAEGPLTVVLQGSAVLSGMVEQAAIPTQGAADWEHFQIGTEHYLAVANQYNHSTYNVASKVYRWNGTAFVEAQSVPTQSATDWEHFQIGADHYLAVANHYNGSTWNIASKVYRWNGTAFVEVQSIPTQGAFDWEHFQIGSDHYLAVTNGFNDSNSTYNIASKVYRWNGTAFVEVQSIATQGAFDWEHFQIGTEHYLAVTNRFNGTTHNLASKVYRWNGTAFVEIQAIATQAAMDWEYFEIGTEHYLAVANHYNGATYNIASKVYRWNGVSFVEVQSIVTQGAHDWEHFQVGAEHYLALANHFNNSTRNITSRVYRWNGAAFVEAQSIPTQGAVHWKHFEIGVEHYLAVANEYNDSSFNISSKIYRLIFE